MGTRSLTRNERKRLRPLSEETEIPIRVTSTPKTAPDSDETVPLKSEAVGWRPGVRCVRLSEQCFEQYSDTELVGLLAHELGHHDGNHRLV